MSASALSSALPRPKYTGAEEDIPEHAKQRGTRVVGPGGLDNQLVQRRSGPPPYGQRSGWRPRSAEDFGDGGSFPEVAVAQYPLDMGRDQSTSSNALALKVNEEGKVDYAAIARRGHSDSRVIHTSFKDLIPLRQQANAGEISLAQPSEEEAEETRKRTQDALTKLIDGAVAAQKPKNVAAAKRGDATYVSYTPDNQMGNNTGGRTRLIKIVEKQLDPMEPPKHKHKKIPRGPPSPPPPVMHSPPRKLTAEDQENWKIPAAVSNWKNAKGYTIPIDKRMASDGRGLQDVTINDKFAQFAEALTTADHHAREEVKQRAVMQQRLAEKEKLQKEENLRQLAQKAREDRTAAQSGRRRSYSRSPSRSVSPYSSRESRSRSLSSRGSRSPDRREDFDRRERERIRKERREENERKLRQSRMGTERRMQQMAREQNRDISEKIALGAAKPTKSAETMYDSRLFSQTSAFATGFNEDQPYDKPLFQAQDAINSIYRPSVTNDADDGETADDIVKGIQKGSRFEELGKAGRGFKGAESGREAGPVQFERDRADPFGIQDMEKAAGGKKRYGLDDREEEKDRGSKRARVEDDD